MLSIAHVTSSKAASHYYEQDNYYAKDSDEAKSASSWYGKGANALGLKGPVDKETLIKLLDGKMPNGQQLGRVENGEIQHRPGYDLTFSAPKSVSILIEAGGDTRLKAAHEHAVKTALGFLEKTTAQTRIMINGKVETIDTQNFVVALFNHDTSRELDPNTHTHSLIFNMTQCDDGKWRSLLSDEIYQHKMLGGMVYRATLAQEAEKIGYELAKTHEDGRFEIKGVPENLIQEMSKRREQIEASLLAEGKEGAKASEIAALKTRVKKSEVNRADIKKQWQQTAANHGFDIQQLMSDAKERTSEASMNAAQDAIQFSLNHLSEREAVFHKKDILRHALSYGLGKTSIHDIEKAFDAAHKNEHLINKGQNIFTTPQAIKTEQSIINLMIAGKHQINSIEQMRNGFWAKVANVPLNNPFKQRTAKDFLNTTSLKDTQKPAAEMILTTNDRVVGIQGYAGTGKTRMLKTVREYSEKAGLNVIGISPKAEAANELEKGSGIKSMTLAKFLLSSRKTESSESLIILDEASMASNNQIHDLLKTTEQLNARLVLVGDKQQLAAVEAGKPFELLQEAGMTVATMKDILRQKDKGLLQAVEYSIAGDIKAALEKVGNNIAEIENKTLRLTNIASDYLNLSKEERDKTLILAPANKDRIELNNLIREGLKQEGSLKGNGHKVMTLTNKGLSKSQMKIASNYQAGDQVRFNQDYKKHGLTKGQYYQVTSSDNGTVNLTSQNGKAVSWQPNKLAGTRNGAVEVYQQQERDIMIGDSIRWLRNDKAQGLTNSQTAIVGTINNQTMTIRLDNGKSIKLNLNENSSRHFDHAYASTVHNAQGKTCENVLVHLESSNPNLTNQRAFYVELSRAEYKAALYTDDKKELTKMLEKHLGEKASALENSQKTDKLQYSEFSKFQATKQDASSAELEAGL